MTMSLRWMLLGGFAVFGCDSGGGVPTPNDEPDPNSLSGGNAGTDFSDASASSAAGEGRTPGDAGEASTESGGTPEQAAGTPGAGTSSAGSSATSGQGGTADLGGLGESGESALDGGTPNEVAGQTASAGDNGAGGSTQQPCSFQIEGRLSAAIPTVGVVDWSTDLTGLTAARIEFTLDDPQPSELNLGSGGPISLQSSRALLLGMKPERSYTYRIVVKAGETVCVSDDQSIQTEPFTDEPSVAQAAGDASAEHADGFVITSPYGTSGTTILDADGSIVWWANVMSRQSSRALMDWEGEFLWLNNANPSPADDGELIRVSMDGTDVQRVEGLERSHHDFAALPDGVMAFLVWTEEGTQSSDLVERAADGTLRTLVTLDGSSLPASSEEFHHNALRYYADGDFYTVSDRSGAGISKFTRTGELLWQVADSCEGAEPSKCAETTLYGNHGHQLLPNGDLLVFRASFTEASPVTELSLQPGDPFTATSKWEYTSPFSSIILGDAQRLANGNTLVTYSSERTIHEVTADKTLVRSLTLSSGSWGYSHFRPTLYGPPQ